MGESRRIRRLKAQLRRAEGAALQNPDPPQPVGVQAYQSFQAVQISMGPLPSPENLAQYEAAHPGTAERIVRQMERMTELAADQQQHRFGLENRVIDGNIKSQGEGTRWAGAVALIAILGGIYLLANDKSVYGLVAILGTLTSLTTVFVVGRRKQVRELAEKRAVEIIEQRDRPKSGGASR